mgnify:CR=1 FL=1
MRYNLLSRILTHDLLRALLSPAALSSANARRSRSRFASESSELHGVHRAALRRGLDSLLGPDAAPVAVPAPPGLIYHDHTLGGHCLPRILRARDWANRAQIPSPIIVAPVSRPRRSSRPSRRMKLSVRCSNLVVRSTSSSDLCVGAIGAIRGRVLHGWR